MLGSNKQGQLGLDKNIRMIGDRPGDMESLTYLDFGNNKVVELHSTSPRGTPIFCARFANYETLCWGSNKSNIHGRDHSKDIVAQRRLNEPAADISLIKTLDFGTNSLVDSKFYLFSNDACMLFSNGALKCWGTYSPTDLRVTYSNSQKEKTDYTRILQKEYLKGSEYFLPLGQENTKKVISDGKSFYAIQENNEVRSWGDKKIAGRNKNMFDTYPNEQPLPFGSKIISDISINGESSCILNIDGTAKCWHTNIDLITLKELKELPFGPERITKIYTLEGNFDRFFNCALFVNGKIKCWGTNDHYLFGQNSNIKSILSHKELSSLDYINFETNLKIIDLHFLSKENLCAEFEDHSLKCWGSNSHLFTGQSIFRLTYGNLPGDMENLKVLELVEP